MLVVNIPEGALGEDASGIRHLEEHHRLSSGGDRPTNHSHERAGRGDVLEGHFAADEIGVEISYARIEQPASNLHFAVRRCLYPPVRRIEANPVIATLRAQRGEKLSLPATNLDHAASPEPMAVDETPNEIALKLAKHLGTCLGGLVVGVVVESLRCEGGIEN